MLVMVAANEPIKLQTLDADPSNHTLYTTGWDAECLYVMDEQYETTIFFARYFVLHRSSVGQRYFQVPVNPDTGGWVVANDKRSTTRLCLANSA